MFLWNVFNKCSKLRLWRVKSSRKGVQDVVQWNSHVEISLSYVNSMGRWHLNPREPESRNPEFHTENLAD